MNKEEVAQEDIEGFFDWCNQVDNDFDAMHDQTEEVNAEIAQEKIRETEEAMKSVRKEAVEDPQSAYDDWVSDNMHELRRDFLEMYSDEFEDYCKQTFKEQYGRK